MSTAAAPVAAAPKVSWLKKIGLFFGKILGIVATETQSVEKIAVPVAEALLPQFVPMIQTADGILEHRQRSRSSRIRGGSRSAKRPALASTKARSSSYQLRPDDRQLDCLELPRRGSSVNGSEERIDLGSGGDSQRS